MSARPGGLLASLSGPVPPTGAATVTGTPRPTVGRSSLMSGHESSPSRQSLSDHHGMAVMMMLRLPARLRLLFLVRWHPMISLVES